MRETVEVVGVEADQLEQLARAVAQPPCFAVDYQRPADEVLDQHVAAGERTSVV